ncbi:MAG: hypothetical protein ACRDZ8_17015 [Acidimicrobiales bacterium]
MKPTAGRSSRTGLLVVLATVLTGLGLTVAAGPAAAAAGPSFLGGLSRIREVASTVPAIGDVNPYGVAVVPTSTGKLQKGAVLVSNFNNMANQQGSGTTIVQIAPGGRQTVFASVQLGDGQACPGGVGLTTALAVFRSGWVVVGSLPTSDGTIATATAGCLIVLNHNGHVVETISGSPINGPWDMTAVDQGSNATLFVTNVLNGTVAADPDPTQPGMVVKKGNIVRLRLSFMAADPQVTSEVVIADGFGERGDPAALVVGPTGLGMHGDVLFVADTEANRITEIPGAMFLPGPFLGPGLQLTRGGNLNSPLGLTIAPDGHVVTVNGGDGNAVETDLAGNQVATKTLDDTPVMGSTAGAGSLFGLAVSPNKAGLYFVDDISNQLNEAL